LHRLPDYAGIHSVSAICTGCGRIADLDLAALVAAGHGDVPLIRLPLRCAACGHRGHHISVSGRAYSFGCRPARRPILIEFLRICSCANVHKCTSGQSPSLL